MALLAAIEVVRESEIGRDAYVGELTLAGGLRPAVGVLPMVLAAAERGITRVFVPEPQRAEAELVPGMRVFGARSLAQVVAEISGLEMPDFSPVAASSGTPLLSWRGADRLDEIDLADLDGLTDVKYALEVAAAGGHPIHLTGPKGAGKTSIAERIPTIMPDLTPAEALELTAIHSLAGALDPEVGLVRRPPYSAPHHDASKASIVGGGQGRVRPGEISRSHCGVLFLDEFALFRTDVIEALRQPLESGDITVARQEESVTLPARCLLVLASNPCPCGNFSARAVEDRCKCLDQVRRAYQARISGPIIDRIDITRRVVGASRAQRDPFGVETSAQVRERVAAARSRQVDRFAGRSWRLNAQIPGARLKDTWPISPAAQQLVDDQCFQGRLSARGAVRVARLAWTVADLASVRLGRDVVPGVDEVGVALRLRAGDPLDLRIALAGQRAG